MKNKILPRLLLISSVSLIIFSNIPAQKSLIYFKVGIPYNFGNTIYSDWDGIINLGFQYSHLRKNNIYLNFYINYDRFKATQFKWNTTQHLYRIGLGLQYMLEISKSAKMYPKFGVGYTYQNLNDARYNTTRDNSGINLLIDLDLLVKIFEKLYIGIGVRYDFVRLAEPSYPTTTGYYTHIHTIIPTVQTVIHL